MRFTVVVLAHTDVHIWRFEGGQVKRLQLLTDTHQSAQLLGIA
jgi:hypothetical protein